MVESLVVAGVVLLVLLVALVGLLGSDRDRDTAGPGTDRPDAGGERERDAASRAAQRRPPVAATAKGERYDLVVQETQYVRDPEEIRGAINGLQTTVYGIPADLEPWGVVRVRVVDDGYEGTTAQAPSLERA